MAVGFWGGGKVIFLASGVLNFLFKFMGTNLIPFPLKRKGVTSLISHKQKGKQQQEGWV